MVGMLAWGQARVPARRDPFAVVQPNGDTIMIRLVGDEAWHCHQTLDGKPIIQGKNGWWYYARECKCRTYTDMRGHKRHKLVKTCKKVKPLPLEKRDEAQMAPPRGLRKHAADSLHYQYVEAYNHEVMAQAMRAPRRVGQPTLAAPRVLVIMVNFSDYSFVRTRDDVDSLFKAEHLMTPILGSDQSGNTIISGYSETGSVRKYFYDQSSGVYNPQFDVVGPVTLSKGYGYYGQNYNGNTSRYAGEMVAEACALVDDQVNFADYDSNGDGKVDLVFIYYAGFGENDPPYEDWYPTINANNLVWPHYHNLTSAGTHGRDRVFDGKTVDAYECANELDGYYSMPTLPIPAGIGVLVHEYCHGLGLPDLYKTAYGTHKTLGMWSIMDYGPYNNDMHSPPSMTAYERSFLGWMQPTLLNQAADCQLLPLSESNQAGYITDNGATIESIANPGTTPFYMVENRQRTGWDIGVPGEGLLLYKITYNSANWNSNNVNNTATAMGVDILEADGLAPTSQQSGYNGKQGDCYPYNTLDSILVAPSYPITNITQNQDGSMSFKVCGGGKPTGVENVNNNENRSRKVLRDGKLYILRGDKAYDILGK